MLTVHSLQLILNGVAYVGNVSTAIGTAILTGACARCLMTLTTIWAMTQSTGILLLVKLTWLSRTDVTDLGIGHELLQRSGVGAPTHCKCS